MKTTKLLLLFFIFYYPVSAQVTKYNNQITPPNKQENEALESYWKANQSELSKLDGTYKIRGGTNSSDGYTFVIKNGKTTLLLFGQTTISVILKKVADRQYDFCFWHLDDSNSLKQNYFNKYSESVPIANIIFTQGIMIFEWFGLYNRVTDNKDWTKLNDVITGDYKLKKIQ